MAPDRGRGIAVKYRIALAFVATSCMAGIVRRRRPAGERTVPTGTLHGAAAGRMDRPLFRGQCRLRLGKIFVEHHVYGRWCFRFNESHYRDHAPGDHRTGGRPNGASGTRVPGSGSPSGAIAGGQIGFNWQAGMFVFGGRDRWPVVGTGEYLFGRLRGRLHRHQNRSRSDRSRPGAVASVWLLIGSCLT